MEITEAKTGDVACSLSASEQELRRQELRSTILSLIEDVTETEVGYQLRFSPEAIDIVREFVRFESNCCSFMTYTVTESTPDSATGSAKRESHGPVSRPPGSVLLGMTGPEGTKRFLNSWLPPQFRAGCDASSS